MKVHLRKKKLKNDRYSLYLEFYESGNRKFEYLNLYLVNKKRLSKQERTHNKKILNLAMDIKLKRELEIKTGDFGFKSKTNISFTKYLFNTATVKGNYHMSAVRKLNEFTSKELQFSEITLSFLNSYKAFLLKSLSSSSANCYLRTIKITLNKAMKEGIIQMNPFKNFENIKVSTKKRDYLNIDEVRSLINTSYHYKEITKSFLFMIYTGLRISDVYNLNYRDLKENQLELEMQKTKEYIFIPLNKNVFQYLEIKYFGEDKLVFNLPSEPIYRKHLSIWCQMAGITKNITPHVARHTFATLQLKLGTDIYTVSKLLGHSNLETTQIYAKIVDQTKIDAINKMSRI